MASRNADDEIRRLERLARAGDIEALGRWFEWALRTQDREDIRTIDALVHDFGASSPSRRTAAALERISRASSEFRHGLPRGSLVTPTPTSPFGVLRAQVLALMDENDCSARDAAELVWVNARDDGMREYFHGTPLDHMTMAELEALLERVVFSVDKRMNPRRNSDEEVRRLEREASAGLAPDVVSRLARAYARAGMVQSEDVWVVEHQRFRGGRSRWELVERLLVGVYSSSAEAQAVAASIAVRDRWKLRNMDARRAFAEAEAAADLPRMIHAYTMGTYYKLLIEKRTLDALPETRRGFDRENWAL